MTTMPVVSQVVEVVALGSPGGRSQAPLTENVLTLAGYVG